MRKNLPIRAASLIATDCDCLHACRYDARVVELTLPEMRRLRYTDVGGAQQTRLFNARMRHALAGERRGTLIALIACCVHPECD